MPEKPEPASEDTTDSQDDVKARFREALERKQAQNRNGEGHADARSKVHDTHGPAAAKRQFRRKSG
ncbi:MAG TPA: DUF5302 domain-containing protein [Actinophytocola sp.]|jgi:hypothetical protein|uniref:DUF5302 domain-containing protein n=1 Tax=Actinophytocola sp. TaxID=1872138 RepID=UPI002F955421